MNKEQKRDFWLNRYKFFPMAISFWAGIGLMSILNIYKTVYNQNALQYDWIMFAFSIIFIIIGSIMYLIKMRNHH